MHNNISDNYIIIIQYSLSMASISLLMAFTPLIVAKFATNVCIFSPLNMSFITINITITEIRAITNIKILNAKCLKIEVSMTVSSSFSSSKVPCFLSKDIFFCFYFSTNSLNVFGADNNSSSKSFHSNDIGKICSCLITLWKSGISKVLISSSK